MLLYLSFAFATAQAVTLPPVPPTRVQVLPIADTPEIPCDQILSRLEQYAQMSRSHGESVGQYLGDVSLAVDNWVSLLTPLEGSSGQIAAGTFAPLAKGRDDISEVSGLVYENTDLMNSELDKIVASLRACPK